MGLKTRWTCPVAGLFWCLSGDHDDDVTLFSDSGD